MIEISLISKRYSRYEQQKNLLKFDFFCIDPISISISSRFSEASSGKTPVMFGSTDLRDTALFKGQNGGIWIQQPRHNYAQLRSA